MLANTYLLCFFICLASHISLPTCFHLHHISHLLRVVAYMLPSAVTTIICLTCHVSLHTCFHLLCTAIVCLTRLNVVAHMLRIVVCHNCMSDLSQVVVHMLLSAVYHFYMSDLSQIFPHKFQFWVLQVHTSGLSDVFGHGASLCCVILTNVFSSSPDSDECTQEWAL